MKHIISLGAGVQSSTMALMAAHGEITPMPDAAIFADTHAEPKAVYDWLEWLTEQLPFPVYTVSAGDLKADSLDMSRGYARRILPLFLGGGGFLGRSCTADYKVRPLRKKVKELLGIKGIFPKKTVVTQWIGISMDEMQRMKQQYEPWQDFRHPLIEQRMARHDCLKWMKQHGYPEPPRSACTFCPFHSNLEWRNLSKDEFQDAVQFEKDIQAALADRLDTVPFLHRDLVPLDEVDLRSAEQYGQISWLDECAGMCGV